MTAAARALAVRCTCHHWRGGGDSGTTRIRARCPNSAAAARDSDGRHVCSCCVDCDPATSEGFWR